MAKDLRLPFSAEKFNKIVEQFGSPIYVYDEAGIRKTARQLKDAFSWATEYKNYFAVKALPNPSIVKILIEEGMGVDCSSRSELLIAQKLGLNGKDIFYTSNNTPTEDFQLAIELGATVNIDDLAQVPNFIKALADRPIARVAARYNPGDLKTGNDIIGQPTEAKYGMSVDNLIRTFNALKNCDIGEFGLHAMVASNELSSDYFAETAKVVLDAVGQIQQGTGIDFGFINLGGGMGLNYRPEQNPFDLEQASRGIQTVFERLEKTDIKLYTENGRFVTGPHGYLVTKVRYVMSKHKNYIGVDASMHNLMRPGMYGAYHHITVLGKDDSGRKYDVVGSLCENNDKFAIDRVLPEVEEGDVVVIHDSGAHGHSMGFNYNGLLRSAEVLVGRDGQVNLIRRAETEDDYFTTLVWPK